MIALVPDLDSRFERLYGYLNDDVTRRRASIGLALELAGASPTSAAARRALSPSGPLVDLGLVLVEDPDRPFLTRSLRVPGPGDRAPARRQRARARDRSSCSSTWSGLPRARSATGSPGALRGGVARSCTSGSGRPAPAAPIGRRRARRRAGREAVVVDLSLLAADADPLERGARRAPARRCCAAPGWWPGRSRRWPSATLESVQRLSAVAVARAVRAVRRPGTPGGATDATAVRRRAGPRRPRTDLPALATAPRARPAPTLDPDVARRPPRRSGPAQVAARRPGRPGVGPARRAAGHRRRPAARRPRPERRRARAAGPPDRAGGRLGRPRAGPRRTTGARASSPPGPGTGTRC